MHATTHPTVGMTEPCSGPGCRRRVSVTRIERSEIRSGRIKASCEYCDGRASGRWQERSRAVEAHRDAETAARYVDQVRERQHVYRAAMTRDEWADAYTRGHVTAKEVRDYGHADLIYDEIAELQGVGMMGEFRWTAQELAGLDRMISSGEYR